MRRLLYVLISASSTKKVVRITTLKSPEIPISIKDQQNVSTEDKIGNEKVIDKKLKIKTKMDIQKKVKGQVKEKIKYLKK